MDKKNEKKKYSPPKITRVKLEDKRGVGMANSCRFQTTDTNCYQDQVTPIFVIDDPGGGGGGGVFSGS